MKIAPINTDVVSCVDIEALAEDPDFDSMYSEIINSLSYELLDDFGLEDIVISAISAFATVESVRGSIFVLVGDFNLEDVRDTLEYYYFVESEYRRVEIWTDDFEYTIAFIDNMIVLGNKDTVEVCIRIHGNEESSMYDNEDMKSVADKLPAGVISMVFGPDYLYDIEILAGGICLRNLTSGDEVWDMNGWLRFDSAASAEAAMEDIEDNLSWELDATNIDAHLSGQFIEFSGEIEIPDY
ncbi:MAG TPA: hypothetical protein G4O18_09825 [Dehalococcoidia bacterium]|nr:hypothetical protein [Dehalococcoidia bacterium]